VALPSASRLDHKKWQHVAKAEAGLNKGAPQAMDHPCQTWPAEPVSPPSQITAVILATISSNSEENLTRDRAVMVSSVLSQFRPPTLGAASTLSLSASGCSLPLPFPLPLAHLLPRSHFPSPSSALQVAGFHFWLSLAPWLPLRRSGSSLLGPSCHQWHTTASLE